VYLAWLPANTLHTAGDAFPVEAISYVPPGAPDNLEYLKCLKTGMCQDLNEAPDYCCIKE